MPREAITVAVSLDGVLVPMKDGRSQEKRASSDPRQGQGGQEPRRLQRSELCHATAASTRASH